jgi:N-acetylneuraminic acid mutarotase
MCVVDNAIYIFGGRDDDMEATTTTYRFSTETNMWATLAPMPDAKCNHCVCVLDGLIYVMGGEDSASDTVSSVHRFDPVANSWSTVAPMSSARKGLAAFVLGGNIHVVSGREGARWLNTMERYCVASESWSEVSGGEFITVRNLCNVHVVRVDVDLFDSLMAKAKRAWRFAI